MSRSLENSIREIMASAYITEDETKDRGELMIGNYQTRHFDMCPSATKLYKNIENKVDDMDLAVRSAKLQDNLFRLEKEAIDDNEADQEVVNSAQNLADQIMKMAKMMGMEKEHDYISMHVDKIKEIADSDDDDDMDEQKDKPPFTPDPKRSGPRKDRFGNVIKTKNLPKHLAKKGMRGEAVDPTDTGGEEEMKMMMTQVNQIRHYVDGIEKMIKADGDMEEWVQNKLTKATDYLKSVYGYKTGKSGMTEEANPKLLAALKKKLKDEGGAAGFEPLKDIAKSMDVDLTPAMLKGMDGIKQHRDGDYILENVELEEGFDAKKATMAAKEIRDYARKSGGIDKKDFMKAADNIEAIAKANLMTMSTALDKFNKHYRPLDTSPREYIFSVLRKHGMIAEGKTQLTEPADSVAQQQAAGAALSAKRGETDPSKLQGASKQMYDTMTTKELDKIASTKHDDLPKRVQKESYVQRLIKERLSKKS